MIHGRHFGGYTDLVMICVHFMLILKVKRRLVRVFLLQSIQPWTGEKGGEG